MADPVVVEREVEIVNRLGLHARAAAKLVHLTGRFRSDVTLEMNGERVDAKSILGVLLLGAGVEAAAALRGRRRGRGDGRGVRADRRAVRRRRMK
jgi:phosphocarrier protein